MRDRLFVHIYLGAEKVDIFSVAYGGLGFAANAVTHAPHLEKVPPFRGAKGSDDFSPCGSFVPVLPSLVEGSLKFGFYRTRMKAEFQLTRLTAGCKRLE